ncbi:hypothetical protein U0038_17655 [Sphingobacterium spiritivorum]|uniref:Uncharacterized protein n=1 Tax=Sphingobacterium spiritivorum ATCC 33861 TaxID=525373 RepID=D7VN27_SPHSI|nr:hypothetical protein [Sphingobacterium spiritivorum]EFK57324.1 hypothetical protein HMPREF0766_12397 [Sphingobacterium spiritivorum ATCC 33861]QQT36594.1 hypothetical protein I6J01_03945 [Sphingobacterium spiritivorum]WQD33345.1 hypothetical protein U0038_17655 [Sphingobacterium spiritivorum]SUJ22548.1 Uncharacterised protein [Sphingobacterium spiritivorum]
MEFKGTKDQWLIDGNFDMSDNYRKFIRDSKGNILFDVSTLLDGQNNKKKIKEAHANAQLVIKAPEMLEMLNHILALAKCGNIVEAYKIEELIKAATKI